MSALTWVIVRDIAPSTAAAALAAVGMASGLLWTFRSHHRLNTKVRRVQRLATNVAGEISALRDESECRWLMQDLWANHRDTADMLFSSDDPPRS